MFSKLQIVNIGLGKIAASQIERLDPPRSAVERFVAGSYDHWKRSELSKRRWVCALEDHVVLGQVAYNEGRDKPYVFALPVEALRPVRGSGTEWKQRGRTLHSDNPQLRAQLIMNIDETDFDPMLVEVLACRVALECAEFITQSNTKKADAKTLYDDAVREAAQNNAYIIGPEDVGNDDTQFEFLTERYDGGGGTGRFPSGRSEYYSSNPQVNPQPVYEGTDTDYVALYEQEQA